MNLWKIVGFVAAFAAIWYFLLPYVGLAAGGLTAFLFVLLVIQLLNYALPQTRKWFEIPLPLSGKGSLYLLIGLAVGVFFTGGFGMIASHYDIGMPTASVSPVSGFVSVVAEAPATTSVEYGSCTREAIGDDNWGDSATVILDAYDQESNTPYSAAINTNAYIWRWTGNGWEYVTLVEDTAAGATSGISVGDYIKIYGGNNTAYSAAYYLDTKEVCVNRQSYNVELAAHTWPINTTMDLTCLDSDGNACTVGVTNFSSYNMTLGAGGSDTITLKLKNNDDNSAYQFCGWAVAQYYNISDVYPVSGFTEIPTPQWLKSVTIINNYNDTSQTMVKDYYVYKRDAGPLYLHEWDYIKTDFVVEADASNDPIGVDSGGSYAITSGTDVNGFAVIPVDCGISRGDDGEMYNDVYAHTVAQSNVGLREPPTRPYASSGDWLGNIIIVG